MNGHALLSDVLWSQAQHTDYRMSSNFICLEVQVTVGALLYKVLLFDRESLSLGKRVLIIQFEDVNEGLGLALAHFSLEASEDDKQEV